MLSHLWPYRKKFETKLKDEEAPKTIATKHSNLESKSLAYPYGSYGISRRILCPQNLAYTLRLYQTITVSTLSTRAPRLYFISAYHPIAFGDISAGSGCDN